MPGKNLILGFHIAQSIDYCLKAGGIRFQDVQHLVFDDKPLVKFERLLETYLAVAPTGLQSFLAAMPVWMKEKLFLKSLLRDEFLKHGEGMKKKELPPMLFPENHESHAASAFYPSPTILRWSSVWMESVSGRQPLPGLAKAIRSPHCGKFLSPIHLAFCTPRSPIRRDLRSIPVSTKSWGLHPMANPNIQRRYSNI